MITKSFPFSLSRLNEECIGLIIVLSVVVVMSSLNLQSMPGQKDCTQYITGTVPEDKE